MKMFALSLLACLMLPFSASALPASKANAGRTVLSERNLVGHWISTDLSGDGIWLIVSQVGLEFTQDGRFTATAVMNGGSDQTFTGKYDVDIGKIRLQPDGQSEYICYYTLENDHLTIKPTEIDVTVKLKHGKLTPKKADSIPNEGMGGMQF